MAKKITLTQDKFSLVDDEDFDFINQWKWRCSETKKGSVIANCPEGMDFENPLPMIRDLKKALKMLESGK